MVCISPPMVDVRIVRALRRETRGVVIAPAAVAAATSKEQVLEPLAEDWEEITSSEGEVYYYNIETEETRRAW